MQLENLTESAQLALPAIPTAAEKMAATGDTPSGEEKDRAARSAGEKRGYRPGLRARICKRRRADADELRSRR
jgi:hypothetical protein